MLDEKWAFRIWVGLSALCFIGMEIALLTTQSLSSQTILLGYSTQRLLLIISNTTILSFFIYMNWVAWREEKKVFEIFIWLRKIFSLSERRIFIQDGILFGFAFIAVTLFLQRVSSKTLSLLFQPLPIIIEHIFIPLLFLAFFFFQSFLFIKQFKSNEETTNKNWLTVFFRYNFLLLTLFFILFFSYTWSSVKVNHIETPQYSYFPNLAEAFLKGNLYLEEPVPATHDLTFYNGKYYVSFPPLAALLMLPLAIGGNAINTVIFTIYASIAGVIFTFLCLESLTVRGWSKLKTKDNLLLTYLLGFGTPLFYMSTTGVVVHTSQVLAFTFLALGTFIALTSRSQLLHRFYWTAAFSGLALGLAMLARPHVGAAGLFFVGIAYQHLKENHLYSKRSFSYWILSFSIPIGLIVLGMFWYNQVRFGSPLDFGYKYMNVGVRFIERIEKFGLFHPTYFWTNFKANFLSLPYWDEEYSRFVPDYSGLSIFFVTPIMLYLGKALNKKPWALGAWSSIILIILIHLMYYNSGWIQFGYRFSLDFMVPAICLLTISMKNKIPKLVYLLFYYSTVINYIGVLWYANIG